jgi:hypothetical protein
MKTLQVGAELFHAHRRTNRLITEVIVAFWNIENSSKTQA